MVGRSLRPGGRLDIARRSNLLPERCSNELKQTAREAAAACSTPGGQTCSAGVAQWDGREHLDHAIRRADEALYAAKASGRDRTALAA
jgi:PleD family two-component response regulator